jgi:hypothetical protein
MEALNRTFEPLAPEGRPAETFAKGGKMTFGKEKLDYTHSAPAHTDSDVYFCPGRIYCIVGICSSTAFIR